MVRPDKEMPMAENILEMDFKNGSNLKRFYIQPKSIMKISQLNDVPERQIRTTINNLKHDHCHLSAM
jgi:hypothetical protein